MYLCTDTETNGFMDFGKPADAPGQPRVAAVAMILCDEQFNVITESELLIRPDGWEMTEEAGRVNGLTNEMLYERGVPIGIALKAYTAAVQLGEIITCHNSQFDCKMMRAELRRAGLPDLFDITKNICTMRGATGVVKATQHGSKRRKFPTLRECYQHFYKRDYDFPHSALGDARAVREVARFLKRINCLPEPKVHYAGENTRAGEALRLRQEEDARREFCRGGAESTEETMPEAHGRDEEPLL